MLPEIGCSLHETVINNRPLFSRSHPTIIGTNLGLYICKILYMVHGAAFRRASRSIAKVEEYEAEFVGLRLL